MSLSVKKFLGLSALALMAAALLVSTTVASSGHKKKHKTKAETTTTTTTTTTTDATDPTKNTGTITSFSGGKLTVKLYGGTKVKAKVVKHTDILVEPVIDETPDTGTSDDGDTDTTTTTTDGATTRHFGGGGGGGRGGDRGDSYDNEDYGPEQGSKSDLTVGRVVEVGDLHAGPTGISWTQILLR
jgi:hypothetical protein